MSSVPYSNAINRITYATIFTRPDILHAINVVSRYIIKVTLTDSEMNFKVLKGYCKCGTVIR